MSQNKKMGFIKVLDPIKIRELESDGFSTYMKEKINGQEVAVFAETPELIRYLQSCFKKGDFFCANKLHF